MPRRPEMMLQDGSKITVIHFSVEVEDGRGTRREAIACLPSLLVLNAWDKHPLPKLRSDDPRGVTCPSCKQTGYFKDAAKFLGVGGVFP